MWTCAGGCTIADIGLFLLPGAEVMHHGGAGGVCELPDQGIIDSLIGLVRYYRKHEGLLCAGVLWLILTVNSLLVLGGGLGKVVVGPSIAEMVGA